MLSNLDVAQREPTRSIPSMGHGNTDVLLSSDSGSVGFSHHGEGPPESSTGWTPGNFEGFLLNACLLQNSTVCIYMLLELLLLVL